MKFKLVASLISGLSIFASVSEAAPGVVIDEFNKFKQLMMYFNEPLLLGAKAKGILFADKTYEKSFEGASSLDMAKDVLAAISDTKTLPKVKFNSDIFNFASYLEIGIDIMGKMPKFDVLEKKWASPPPGKTELQIFAEEAVDFQNEIIAKLKKDGDKIVLPFGWLGKQPHAINLIIEKVIVLDSDGKPSATYNLIIVNTGDGMSYHYAAPDPNKVYPWLNQLWIKFKNIPENELFDPEDAWFAQMMIKLQHSPSVDEQEKAAKSAPNYFYASVLSNFKKYLDKDELTKNDNKLSPAQRSGSCTLSSLMASYLYFATDKTTYNYNRVILGHKLLDKFLNDEGKKDSFKTLITDGFDSTSVYCSALQDSALIGEGRSNWIRKNKESAIKALKTDKDTLDIVKNTVDLSTNILKIINDNPINPETNKIQSTLTSLSDHDYNETKGSPYYGDKIDEDFYKLLKVEIPRPDTRYEDLDSLIKRLNHCKDIKGVEVHVCALDAFRMTKKDWWTFLDDSSNGAKVLTILELFGQLTKTYLGSFTMISNFDDIVFLAHLQIGSWKCALVYDEQFASLKLGLKNFSPPFIIHHALSKQLSGHFPVISGSYESLLIKTAFTAKSLSELSFLLEEYLKLGSQSPTAERFLGPGEFIGSSRNTKWNAKEAFKKISLSKENKRMYNDMMEQKDVKTLIQKIKADKANKKNTKWGSEQHSEYNILMTSIERHPAVMGSFPHFHRIWAQMIWLHHSLGLRPVRGDSVFKTDDQQNDVDDIGLGTLQSINGEPVFPEQPRFDIKYIDECRNMKISPNKDIFYKLRHSQALRSPANIVNFESWLNYIKGAADPAIFDHPYFSYLSGFIMNVPRIDLSSPYKIDQRVKETYVDGFTKHHVREIFNAFMRLINMDLNYIISKQGRLELTEKTKLIKRPVNIAIPLVKFLGRVDHDKIINGHTVSLLLSKIYMAFYRFSPLSNSYGLEDTDISTVNLVLAQITDLPIRNSKTFIENIKSLGFPKDLNIYRKSLSRVHWFITKMYFIRGDVSDFSHANDLYNYGFIYYPVLKNEIPCMSYLLQTLFLGKHDEIISNWDKIEYYENGDIVRATSTSKILVAIQLSSGKVVKNGNLMVEKGLLLNDKTFNSFFSKEDMNDAVKGEISKIGTTVLYALNDFKFKGNLIVFLCPPDDYCHAYRKYNNNWYLWNPNADEFKNNIPFKWIHEHKLFFRRNKVSPYDLDTIIIADNKEKPLLRLKTDLSRGSVGSNSIFIDDFAEEAKPWTLLKIKDKVEFDTLDRRFRAFSDTGLVLAKVNDGRAEEPLAIIYPGLRLKEDPNRPLTLVQTSFDDKIGIEFEIKNSPGLKVLPKQAIKDEGIKGTLIVQKGENQIFMAVPIQQRKYTGDFKVPVVVDLIPIVDDLPAPQTRLQRLLLAYHYIRARYYALAREYLQPSVSINQNETFDPSELEVLVWIIKIAGGGPEAEALKLVAYTHVIINRTKFPLDYIADKDDLTKEGILKDRRFILSNQASTSTNEIFSNYLLSIRDLPEKYYVYRIFPEFLDLEAIKNLFKNLSLGNNVPSVNKNVELKTINCETDDASSIFKMNENAITDKTIYDFFNNLVSGGKDDQILRFLRVKSKLMHRIDTNNGTRHNGNEMIIYCAHRELDKWKNIAEEYMKYCKNPEKPLEATEAIKKLVKGKIIECIEKNQADFMPFNLNPEIKSDKTKADDMIKTLKSDSKKYVKSTEVGSEFNIEDLKGLDIVKDEDKAVFKKYLEILQKLVDVDKSADNIKFDYIGISKVLAKLSGSISDFISQKGKLKVSEIDLEPVTVKALKEFNFFLEGKINDVNIKLNDMEKKMNKDVYEPTTSTEAHLIEELTRNLHSRKKKVFGKLYPCYQKMSVECVQSKFPQLSLTESKNVLKETFIFYSNSIFKNFLKTLSESIEKFIFAAMSKAKVSVDDISLFLDEAQKFSDFNTRLKQPAVLNFEYCSKRYRLRKEQVDDIDTLTALDSKTGSFKSVVIQRMMAAGKTLVLGTISVVQKALYDGKLSILVPPSSLYQSNLSAMQARTYSFYKTKGQNFIFPRLQFSAPEELRSTLIPFLKYVKNSLEFSMDAKEYFVLSPDSLQAFLNAYIEMLNFATFKYDGMVKEALGLYAEIYDLFKTKGSIILDEIDMTMDPKKELNFPTMENEPYNLMAVTLMTDLIEFSVFDEKVRAIGLDIYSNNQSSLTSENYEKYMAILINYIESQLKDPKSLWSERLLDKDVKDILTPAKIMEFFRNPDIAYMKSWINELNKLEKQTIAETLIIIKVQLYQNLKASLNASANLNYGAAGSNRAHILYAIPFLAANTPSPSSEFADRWETLNKTLLMFASVPCTKIIAKNMIGYIRKSAIRETTLTVAIEETQTSKAAQTLITNLNIMKLNDEDDSHVEMMHKALINRSPTAIRFLFSYAVDEIFSEMKFPVEQITSNALNMASMFNSVQGYSGTIDNVNILPREVVVGAYKNHMENEKNNGGISYKLVKDSEDKDVYQLTDEDLKSDIGSIIGTMVSNGLDKKFEKDLSAIIDAGAFFKNFKNREVAQAIYERFQSRINVVLYYDEESNQVEFIKKGDKADKFTVGYISSTDPDSIQKATQVDLNQRFTYYDQRHITGSDILQPKSARALMTVGTRILLRDILQGTLRMRQFMTSQKVHLVTSTASANFYFSKCNSKGKTTVNVADLLTLGAFNEDDKQKLENEKLAYVKIDNEVRRYVLGEITRTIKLQIKGGPESDNIRRIISAWFAKPSGPGRNIRDLFIRYIKENPINWMVTPVKKNSEQVLKNYKNYWIEVLRRTAEKVQAIDPQLNFEDPSTISGKSFVNLKEDLEILVTPFDSAKKNWDSLLAFLGNEIVERGALTDGGCEVQMQVFTQNLVEFDLDKISKTYSTTIKVFPRHPFDLKPLLNSISDASVVPKAAASKNTGVASLNEILFDSKHEGIYKALSRAATISKGRRVFVSLDIVQLIEVPPPPPYTIYSQYTWEGSHILVQILPKLQGIRLTLLSTESANEIRNELLKKDFASKESFFWLCDLYGTVTLTNEPKTEIGESIFNIVPPNASYLFFDALVFNGSFEQILTNPVMKKIYTEKWLKSENYQLRSKFMLLRMHNLAEKAKKIFGSTNSELEILNRASQGDKDALNSMKSSSSAFKKPRIPESVEDAFFAKMTGLARQKVGSSDASGAIIDSSKIYMDITTKGCPTMGELENAGLGMVFDLSGDKLLSPEYNADSSTVDEFEKDLSSKKRTEFLNVVNDPNDLNIDNEDGNLDEKPKDYSVLIVIVFGLVSFSGTAFYYYRRTHKSQTQVSPEQEPSDKNMSEEDETGDGGKREENGENGNEESTSTTINFDEEKANQIDNESSM